MSASSSVKRNAENADVACKIQDSLTGPGLNKKEQREQ